jgi:hypothetical protein
MTKSMHWLLRAAVFQDWQHGASKYIKSQVASLVLNEPYASYSHAGLPN